MRHQNDKHVDVDEISFRISKDEMIVTQRNIPF